MNSKNPIRLAEEAKEAARLEAAKGSHLPIHVCCVLDSYEDFDNPVLHMVRDHCQILNVLFTTRLYDSDRYSCDRYYIERLPAFHIYMKKGYMKTYYTNTRPLQNIHDVLELYRRKEDATLKRKHLWRKRFLAVLNWFKRLGHRKTRMEKYQEEKEKEKQMEW